MNREEHLQKTFPLEDGTTYIQNLDKVLAEDVKNESYVVKDEKGEEGVSTPKLMDYMYNWIRKHSRK